MPKTAQSKTAPIPNIFPSPAIARLLAFSALQVGLITWGLFQLRTIVMGREHVHLLRPYSIAYVIAILVMTSLGGKWIGRFTLALSVLMTGLVLIPPTFSWYIQHPRDWVEMVLLLVVGEVTVRVVDYMRREMALLEDVENSPFTTSLLERVKAKAKTVPGVQGIGQCMLRRRGIEYFVEADIFVDGTLTQREGQVIVAHTEEAMCSVYGLIGGVRVRLRPNN